MIKSKQKMESKNRKTNGMVPIWCFVSIGQIMNQPIAAFSEQNLAFALWQAEDD
jgi:hypothetical protein